MKRQIKNPQLLFLSASMVFIGCGSTVPSGGTTSAGSSATGGASSSTATSASSGASSGGSGSTATASSGGASGGSTGTGSGTSSGGAAIVAPDDQWTWVEFPDALCANGSPTGLGVNPHAGSDSLVIYLEGGGGCGDSAGCWGTTDAGPEATNTYGYDAGSFYGDHDLNYPALNRDAGGNPFAAANMVFIPYCTGDLHSGDTTRLYSLPDGGPQLTYFYGAHDMDAYLARLVPTFAQVTRVTLLGTSAGGFGTMINFDRVVSSFDAGVDIIDDSGPPIAGPDQSNNAGALTNWGFVPPTECPAPCNSYAELVTYDTGVQANWSTPGRFGFLSFIEDTTISRYYGYSLAAYPAALESSLTVLPPPPAAATFLINDSKCGTLAKPSCHVVESDPAYAPLYLPWMTEVVNHQPGWGDVALDGG